MWENPPGTSPVSQSILSKTICILLSLLWFIVNRQNKESHYKLPNVRIQSLLECITHESPRDEDFYAQYVVLSFVGIAASPREAALSTGHKGLLPETPNW